MLFSSHYRDDGLVDVSREIREFVIARTARGRRCEEAAAQNDERKSVKLHLDTKWYDGKLDDTELCFVVLGRGEESYGDAFGRCFRAL